MPSRSSLGLYERSGFASEIGAAPVALGGEQVAPAYIYVRVDDVRATLARVEEAGGRPLSPLARRAWGEEAAWFADPDANVIGVGGSLAAEAPEASAVSSLSA